MVHTTVREGASEHEMAEAISEVQTVTGELYIL